MNMQTNQSPCAEVQLSYGSWPISGATLKALSQRASCLRSQAIFAAARAAVGALKNGASRFSEGLKRFNARRRAIAELNRLDDRLLADIGIRREQIPEVVAGLSVDPRAHVDASGRRTEISRVDCGPAINDDDCRPLAA